MRIGRGLAAAALAGFLALAGTSGFVAQAQEAVRIGTSSAGGVFYIVAVGLSEMLTKHANINATVEPVGGSHANMFGIQADKVDLAIANSGAAYDAYHGSEPFQQPVDLRMLGQGQESYRYILVRRDAGIDEPQDLAGKTFIGSRPSLPELEMILSAVAEVNDVPVTDINVVSTVTSGETDKELRAGTVAGALMPGGARMPIVSKLFQDEVVDFLYLPEEQVREIVDNRLPRYFFVRQLPAGHFEGQEKPITLFGLKALLVSDAELSDDTAYQVTKTLFENQEEFGTYHSAAKQWTLDATLDSPPVPFHPGAIRYFKEKGAWTDELEARQQELLNKG
jgi:TRAP transporter TAXI family solute receptor